ncbi:uncharacterized protein VTP21DRAFT_8776 [Calcarisporiella thermophila]|uniref:uncharacterized protein n=1 Tax=Calcarisporiella thermophila TaxID=911321 RepID=UPI0037428B1E
MPSRPFANLVMCCTGLDFHEKIEVSRKVKELGGNCDPNFTRDVTHVVARAVGSEKYKVAIRFSVKVVKPEAIFSIYDRWLTGEEIDVPKILEKYLLPPFAGLTICVTGLNGAKREEIEQLTRENGGAYSADLTRAVSHLIASSPTGKKYEFALKWGIKIVNLQWFEDSLDTKACADERNYQFHTEDHDPVQTVEKPLTSRQTSALPDAGLQGQDIATSNNFYLDGCHIFLGEGFGPDKTLHLKKIIMEGGGLRHLEYRPSVITHFVISGQKPTANDMLLIRSGEKRPCIVREQWLRNCYRDSCLHPVEPHLYNQNNQSSASNTRPTTSTTAANPANGNQSDQLTSESETLKRANPYAERAAPIRKARKYDFDVADFWEELAAPKAADSSKANPAFPKFGEGLLGPAPMTSKTRETADNDNASSVVPPSVPEKASGLRRSSFDTSDRRTRSESRTEQQADTKLQRKDNRMGVGEGEDGEDEAPTQQVCGDLFQGMYFGAAGFSDMHIEVLNREVTRQRGVFLLAPSEVARHKGAYVVVPLRSDVSQFVLPEGIVVTECWLERCLEEQRICSPDEHITFTPLSVSVPIPGFEQLFISISGYTGLEREHIRRLVTHLGARFSETFSRQNTHLLCPAPSEGLKYTRAREWKTPTITFGWIEACTRQGMMASLAGFWVGPPQETEAGSKQPVPNHGENGESENNRAQNQLALHPDEDPFEVTEREKSGSFSSGLFYGVTIVVSSRLANRAQELYDAAAPLGARFLRTLDDTTTHYIHQGTRANELSREFRMAKQKGIFIVSPYWIFRCKEAGERLDERDFPHTYNPDKVLSVTTQDRTESSAKPASTAARRGKQSASSQSKGASADAKAGGAGVTRVDYSAEVEKLIERANKDRRMRRRTTRASLRSVPAGEEESEGDLRDSSASPGGRKTRRRAGAENGGGGGGGSTGGAGKSAGGEEGLIQTQPDVVYDDPESRQMKEILLDQLQKNKRRRV